MLSPVTAITPFVWLTINFFGEFSLLYVALKPTSERWCAKHIHIGTYSWWDNCKVDCYSYGAACCCTICLFKSAVFTWSHYCSSMRGILIVVCICLFKPAVFTWSHFWPSMRGIPIVVWKNPCGITKRWVDRGLQNRMMSISSIAVLNKVIAAWHCVVHVDHEVHRNTFALATHLHDILG